MTLIESPQLVMDLSEGEQQQLTRCEAIIEEHLQAFWKSGSALITIRENRLYRATHATFEEYCEQRWKIDGSYGRRLMSAATTMVNLAETVPIGTVLPENEAQARPLSALPADKQTEAWKKSVETAPDGTVTAKHVHEVVQTFRPPQEPKQKPGAADAEKALQAFMDDEGDVVGTTTSPSEEAETKPDPEEVETQAMEVIDRRAVTTSTTEAAAAPAPLPEVSTPANLTRPETKITPLVPAPPAPEVTTEAPPVQAAAPVPVAVVPAPGTFVTCLLPASEQYWLDQKRMSAGAAIAELRRMQEDAPTGNLIALDDNDWLMLGNLAGDANMGPVDYIKKHIRDEHYRLSTRMPVR